MPTRGSPLPCGRPTTWGPRLLGAIRGGLVLGDTEAGEVVWLLPLLVLPVLLVCCSWYCCCYYQACLQVAHLQKESKKKFNF